MKPKSASFFAVSRTPFHTAIAISISFACLGALTQGADSIKQNNTDSLNLASSWDALPGSGDVAVWNSTVTTANTTGLGGNLSWSGLKVVDPGGLVTINTGSTLTLGTAGIDMSAATQDLTLNPSLTLGANQSWNIASGRTLTAGGGLGGTGTTLIKAGTGALTLNGPGFWSTAAATPQYNVTEGTLTMDATGVASAANLLNSGWNISSGAVFNLNYNTAASTLLFRTGALSGAGTVNLGGNGCIDFWSPSAGTSSSLNGFSGQINVGCHTFSIQTDTLAKATTTASVNVAAGKFLDLRTQGFGCDKLTGTGIVADSHSIGGTETLTVGTANGSSQFDGVIKNSDASMIGYGAGGVLAFAKTGTGTFTLTGAHTYTGGTTIKDGSLILTGGGDRLLTTGAVVLGDTSTAGKLVLGDLSAASNQTFASLTATGNGGSVVGGNASTNSLLTLNIASANTFAGSLGGAGASENNLALTKTGAGTLTLSGTNSYVGTTTVNAGTLAFGKAASFYNSTPGTVSGGNAAKLIVESGATGAFYVGGADGFAVADIDTVLANSSASVGFKSGSILGLNPANAGGSFTFSSAIANPNSGANTLSLIKLGTGQLTLTGASTHTGTTTVSHSGLTDTATLAGAHALVLNCATGNSVPGDLQVGNSGSGYAMLHFGASNQIADTSVVTFSGTAGNWAYFKLLGFNETVAGLSSAANGVTENMETETVNTNSTLTVNTTGTNSYSYTGHFRSKAGGTGTGLLGLTKTGTGTQTFVGANIIHTGPTSVAAGKLVLSGTTGFVSATTVENGATLEVTHAASQGMNAAITLKHGATLTHNATVAGSGHWTNSQPTTVTSGAAATFNENSIANTASTSKNVFMDGGLKGGGGGAVVTINATNAGNGLALRNNNTDFNGTLIVNGIVNSTVNLGSGIAVGGCTTGLQNADIQLNGTMELLNQGIGWANTASGAFQMGALSGNGVMVGNSSGTGVTTVTLGVNGHSAFFSGTIVNGTSNTVHLVKTGAGTQILTNASTYTGTTTVNGGILSLSDAAGTATTTTGVTLNGGTLKLDNTAAANNSNRLNNAAAVTLNSGTFLFSNDAGAASFSETAGALSLGAGAFGTVSSSQAATLQSSALTFSSLTRGAGAAADFVGTGLGLDARNQILFTTAPTLTNGIIGTWATVNGTDLATYGANGVTAYTGYADVTRLSSGPQSIADGSTTNVRIIEGTGSAGNITLGAATTTINSLIQSPSGGTSAATIDLASNTLQVNGILAGAGAGALTLNNGTLKTATTGSSMEIDNQSGNVVTVNSPILVNGASGLTKSGPNAVVLTNANTYTGSTVIGTGTLQVTGTLGASASYAGAVTNAGLLQFTSTAAQTLTGAMTGSGSLLHDGASTLSMTTAGSSYTGSTTIGKSDGSVASVLNIGTGSVLNNTAAITIHSGAILRLSGAANNQIQAAAASPSLTVNGTLDLTTGQAHTLYATSVTLNNGSILSNGGAGTAADGKVGQFGGIYLGGSRTMLANGSNSISGTGGIGLGSGTILTFNTPLSSDTVAVATTLGKGNSGSAGGLAKTGSGKVTLSGTNGYTGGTTVSAGTLLITNTSGSGTGTGAVNVQSGATLGGTGSASGATTIAAGANVAPGNSTGTLTLGSATLAGTYQCQLDVSAGDRLTVTGALTISPGAAITVSTLATPTAASYTILSYGSLTGSLPAITPPSGYTVDTTSTPGEVKLVKVSGYASWAATNAPTGTPAQDYDGDGVSNALEWILGGLASTNDQSKLPAVSTSGGNLVFTFVRNDAAWQSGDTTTQIQVGTTLASWPSVYNVGIDTASSSAGVTVTNNGSTDTVTLSVPMGADPKKFARLKATVTP